MTDTWPKWPDWPAAGHKFIKLYSDLRANDRIGRWPESRT
jgi:hypothetical protein